MSSALSVSPLLLQDTGESPTRTRRQFPATYKLQILAAAACTMPGELGALLRREGLYSSHLAMWRAAQRRGDLQGPVKRRGPARLAPDPARKQIVELERAERIIDAPKKFSQLLGLTLPPPDGPTETRSCSHALRRNGALVQAAEFKHEFESRCSPPYSLRSSRCAASSVGALDDHVCLDRVPAHASPPIGSHRRSTTRR